MVLDSIMSIDQALQHLLYLTLLSLSSVTLLFYIQKHEFGKHVPP